MLETLTIMLDDLKSEVQEEILKFYGYETVAEGNLDIVPLFVLETEEQKERSDERLQRMDSD